MIPIDIKYATERKKGYYDNFIQQVKKKIKKYAERGYVKNKSKDDNGQLVDPFSDDKTGKTQDFFNWLANTGLEELANASPSELEQKIDYIEENYPDIEDKKKSIYKNVYHAFVTVGYTKNLSKDKFIDSIGIKCCPYCNRVYVHSVNCRDKKTVKGEIDHFYIKEDYPYLALSFFNLIPSCSFCNGVSGKHSTDCKEEKIINPYEIKENEFKFTFEIKDVKSYYSNEHDAIKVKLNTSERLIGNEKLFHLNDLYQTHADHASELIFKSKIKYPYTYRQFLLSAFESLNLTNDEIDKLIIGNYANKEDFHKRPLAKLYYDISKELGLID